MVAHDDGDADDGCALADRDDGCALADKGAGCALADQGSGCFPAGCDAGCSPTVDGAGCGNDDVSVDESSGVVVYALDMVNLKDMDVNLPGIGSIAKICKHLPFNYSLL